MRRKRHRGKRFDELPLDVQHRIQFLKRDKQRVAKLRIPDGKPVQPEEFIFKLLRVETPYFCAGAIWQKYSGGWFCVEAAPILRWMKPLSPLSAKLALIRMDAQFTWSEALKNRPAVSSLTDIASVGHCVPTTQQPGSKTPVALPVSESCGTRPYPM